jgi:hypothetical protein
MGLLVLSSAPLFAQSGSSSGGTATGGASQADQDVDAARRAAAGGGSPSSGASGVGTGGSAGSSGTGAGGTGATGGDAGIGARPDNPAGDAVDRSRQRNLPGSRPGDAPSQRPGGSVVTQPDPGATDVAPDETGAGTSAGSRPGASLDGMPSGGASTTNDAITPDGGTDAGAAQRDVRTTVRMIGETSFAYRDRAMAMVEGELSAGGSLGSSILRGVESLSGTARTRVDDNMTRVNEARTELAKAISRARSANESRWNASRSEVAERYEAYAKALADAREAAVEAGVQLPEAPAATPTTPAPR